VALGLAVEWNIELGQPFALSRHSYVAPAGEDAVLKVASPTDDESWQVHTPYVQQKSGYRGYRT